MRNISICCLAIALGFTAYFGVISDKPLPYHPMVDGYNDTLLHILAFASLTFLSLWIWRNRVLVMLTLLSAGIAIELLQAMKPTRTTSAGDVWANIVGVLVGLAVYSVIRLAIRKRADVAR